MHFLDTILPVKQHEVTRLKKRLAQNRFAKVVQQSKSKMIFIAEIKPRSPSAGQLILGDPLDLVSAYERGGADMISVLTDSQFFGGGTELFAQVRKTTKLPLLRKDFIIDEAQLIESLLLKVDAVLLIVQLLTPRRLRQLINFATQLGLVPLVEITNDEELKTALQAGAQYLGVNARDLRTMQVDVTKALMVLKKIPSTICRFLFSGIEDSQQIKTAAQAQVSGVLIGTSLIKTNDPARKLRELRVAAEESRDVD